MITKSEWKKAKLDKISQRKLCEREIEKYLSNGGAITRYEKWGKVQIIKRNLDGDFYETDSFPTLEAYENWKNA